MPAKKARRRRLRGPLARRFVAVGALVLVALLYYRPLHDYLAARGQRAERIAAVARLEREHAALERRLRRASSLDVLAREARLLGYIRPGEQLYIVKDVPQWQRRQRARRHAVAHGHGG
jgi:cell division protein FtsB